MVQGEQATDRFLASVKAAIAQARPKMEAIERAYKKDLVEATQPGTLYKGQVSHGSSTMPAEVRFIPSPSTEPGFARFELRLPASGFVYTCSAKLAARVPNLPSAAVNTGDAASSADQPGPRADLIMNYEGVSEPKFNRLNALANEFRSNLTGLSGPSNVPLSLRSHQLRGKVASLSYNPFVLSAEQSP